MTEKEFEIEVTPITTIVLVFPAIILLLYALVFLLTNFSFLWYFAAFGVFALSAVFVYILYKTNSHELLFTLLLLEVSIFILLSEVQVTFSSPIAFGDEGYHTEIAKLIAKNVQYYVWMPFEQSKVMSSNFGRPPLWNLLEASFYYLFGFNSVIVKIITPLISVLTGLAAYGLFRKSFNTSIGFFTAIILITIPSIVTYADLFYVDTLLVFCVTLFLGFFLLYEKEGKRKYLITSTIFAAFAILTKVPGFVIIFFYGLYFIYEIFKTKNFNVIKKYFMIFTLLVIFLGGFAIRNIQYYNTPMCGLPIDVPLFKQNCATNPSYTAKYQFSGDSAQTGTEADVYAFGVISYFTFAYGAIWFVPLVFIIGILMIAIKREKLGLILLIFLISLVPLFYLTYYGRAEDAARYTLSAVPVISLVAANYLDVLAEFLVKYKKILPMFFLVAIIVISLVNFYEKNSVMQSVKQFSPLFLGACDWVKTHLPENATLLSLYGHPTVYNCERNAVWEMQDLPDIILSNDLNLTTNRLKIDGIDYIFVQKFAMSTQAYRRNYPISFVAFLEQNPQTFKKVFENGPDYSTCLQSGGCDGSAIYEVVFNSTKISQ